MDRPLLYPEGSAAAVDREPGRNPAEQSDEAIRGHEQGRRTRHKAAAKST